MRKRKTPTQRPRNSKIIVVSGASQSGKTTWTMHHAQQAPRCMVWDIEDQWSSLPGFERITRRADLVAIAEHETGPRKVAYVAGGNLAEEFNYWAASVLYWGRYKGGCVAVAEELADVSAPGKAPRKWGILVRRGLKRDITIYAISQRWAEADKTCVNNATRFVVFRTMPEDTIYMARKTGAPAETLRGLMPPHFVEIDAATGKTTPPKKLKF